VRCAADVARHRLVGSGLRPSGCADRLFRPPAYDFNVAMLLAEVILGPIRIGTILGDRLVVSPTGATGGEYRQSRHRDETEEG
jgi:hypothetical protein